MKQRPVETAVISRLFHRYYPNVCFRVQSSRSAASIPNFKNLMAALINSGNCRRSGGKLAARSGHLMHSCPKCDGLVVVMISDSVKLTAIPNLIRLRVARLELLTWLCRANAMTP
jgi:hypothetical protein